MSSRAWTRPSAMSTGTAPIDPSTCSRSASTRATRSRAAPSSSVANACASPSTAVPGRTSLAGKPGGPSAIRLTEHRRVHGADRLAGAEVHVHAARQARGEAADRAHDVDPAEVLLRGLLEDGLAGDRVLVRPRGAVGVGRAAVPRRRRIRVVVGDLAVADDEVVREDAADGLVEAAADGVVGDVEVLEDLRPPGPDLVERAVEEVQRHAGRVGDEVDPRAVALDRVGPLRDLPL